jgi:predicted O-methyltransferase YrrM
MEQELFDVLSELEMKAWTGIVPYEAAKMASILAVSNKARIIVEVGSGIGYATLWLAYAASLTGGQVVTCELDPAKAEQTRANLDQAGMAAYVEILSGDARDTLRQREEAVDFLFLDGENSQYETYFDVVYKQMGVGALIVASGVVADEDELADYTTYVQNHPNLESVTVPIGDGLEVSAKISE